MTLVCQKSFNAGEISPALYARNDIPRYYNNGLRTLKNGFVHAEGCVSNRAGLEFVCEVKNSAKKTRIIPFSFNTEQTYIIELGDEYARYIKNGGQIVYPSSHESAGSPVETVTPYAEADLFKLKFAQNADVLTICHNNYSPCELSRSSHYDWSIDEVVSSAQIAPPDTVSAVWTGGTSSNTTTYEYLVTSVMQDSDEESDRSTVASVVGHLEAFWTTSEYVTVSWSAVTGASEYNVYRSVNGIFAYVGTATGTTFKDNKIEPDLTSTAPIFRDPFENDNNPATVNYYKQRKIFGCLKNNPQALVASQTGTENNFNVSRPLTDSDSLSLKMAEREVNEIRHIIGLNDLIVLTSGAEWKLSGEGGAISASSPPVCVPQSYYGCSHVQPCVSGRMVLFVQAGGSVVRDLGYEYVSDSYDGDELTLRATHLFQNKQVVDMAYAKEPYRILWCVMSDGTVNALTYNKKQEVAGWSRHETKGEFESVAIIREGFEDVPYFVVKRKINGQTKRFIERMASRIIENVNDGFFVDCGLKTVFPSAVTTISGLNHLENEKVAVCADGGAYYKTVQNGSITLDTPAKCVSVGLPYTFQMQTLNIEGEATFGQLKIINHVDVKIQNSREDFFYKGADNVSVQNARSIDSVNNSALLSSTNVKLYPVGNYDEETNFTIEQSLPLPLSVLSLTFDVEVATA